MPSGWVRLARHFDLEISLCEFVDWNVSKQDWLAYGMSEIGAGRHTDHSVTAEDRLPSED